MLNSMGLGKNFRHYFDLVICSAKKPEYWKITTTTPHCGLVNDTIDDIQGSIQELSFGNMYFGGNINLLLNLIKSSSKSPDPKICYFGDHLISDLIIPLKNLDWYVIACIHEISDLESKTPKPNKIWGNFFTSGNPEAASEPNELEGKIEKNEILSYYANLILQYSTICISSINSLTYFHPHTEFILPSRDSSQKDEKELFLLKKLQTHKHVCNIM